MEPSDSQERRGSPLVRWGLVALLVVLAVISAYSLVSLTRERNKAENLAAANQVLNASLHQVQAEVRAVSDKLNAVTAPPPVTTARAPRAATRNRARGTAERTVARASAAEDSRWREVQQKLGDQQKQITDTKQQLDQTRDDLQSKLDSARDDLGGSIAKNHDELVAMQKRGERNFYEFDLTKSKQFSRVGPLNISLRKVNRKHRYYDLALMADDQPLEKKHVSLYEPLVLTLSAWPEPVQLVVNQINDNEVKGYISEPKYKKSDLAANAPSATPAPADGSNPALQRR